MILVVCANPALDRLLVLPELGLDGVNRTSRVEVTVAGKGINVARALQTMGLESHLFLFLGGENGNKVARGLSQECLPFDAWPTLGETRLTTIIHEEKIHRHTVINESGPIVPFESSLDLIHSIEKQLKPDDFLILSGSLPRGVRRDLYSVLIHIAHQKKAYSVLDSSGIPFSLALKSIPFLVKPNVKEAEEALGFAILSLGDKIKAVACFQKIKIPLVILSDGPNGLVVGYHDEVFIVKADNTLRGGGYAIGSGDTLVGGVVAQLSQQVDVKDAIIFGTACGLANTFCSGAGVFNLDMAHQFMEHIFIENYYSSKRR
ncbi:MAG: hexose kinase [Atribacterota bacterium]|uniref:Tagatose-6-phosphate kinase n=1 Tax=Candidatus Atribacter allofermentans TaxID=1852833 RepID=A0A1V5T236_9BACT|nr:hexose kinase [Atribacterota bacterium]OQA60768.1 MAG: Tagatose-6-phosphate kinase [Candidatus Atribacteria bacterium ADurb.Bin276]HOT04779.1 hexose kinase [Atribacter sp.]